MSPVKLLGLSSLLLSSLLGCSSVKDSMRPVELEKITPSYSFKNEWRNFVGVGQDARYSRLQPLSFGGALYTVDVKGNLKKLDPISGDILWTLSLEAPIGGGIGTGGGLLFVGSLAGEVIAVDPEKVVEKWRVDTGSEIVSAPQANGDIVVVSAIDGHVSAYDLTDGTRRWKYDHPVPILSLRSNSSPLIIGNNVFIGFDNGQLLSFNASNGQLLWNARVGQPKGKTELERLVDVDSNPIEYGPYIYGAGFNSRIIAATKGSGVIMWAQDLSTAHNIVAADDVVVVVDVESHLKALNSLTGDILWESDKLHRRNATAPAVINGVVVVVDLDGVIHGFSLQTGELIARYHSRHNSIYSQPIVVNDLIYLLDTYGEISAFSLNPIKQSSVADSEAN